MFDCTLEGFALSQMQIAAMCKEAEVSEADTTEKLILPILYRVYRCPLFIERASRATSGEDSKRWDVQFYRSEDGSIHKGQALGVMECKAAHEQFLAPRESGVWNFNITIKREWGKEDQRHKDGKTWNLKKLGNGLPQSVRDYINRGFTSAGGDFILQVWMNEHRYNPTQEWDNAKRIWSNGTIWLVFKDPFFEGDNPPRLKLDEDKLPLDCEKYLEIIKFPIDGLGVDAWCESFNKLKELLNPQKSEL